MPDETPVPPLSGGGEPAPVVQPPATPPVVAAPSPQAPDSVTLTKREMEQHIEKAVAEAVKAVQSKPMANENDKDSKTPSAEEIAKLNARIDEVLAASKAEKEAAAARVAEVEAKLAEAEKRAEDERKRADEERARRRKAKDKIVEANLRKAAAKAGIEDEEYALVLYARAASAAVSKKDEQGNPAPEAPPSPEEFFSGLVKAKPALSRQAPPAPPANTAPSGADPGGSATPAPSKAGSSAGRGEESPVEDLNERDFAARTRAKYNFNPNLAV